MYTNTSCACMYVHTAARVAQTQMLVVECSMHEVMDLYQLCQVYVVILEGKGDREVPTYI